MIREQPLILLDLGGVVFDYRGKQSPTINWDIVLELNSTFSGLSLGKDTLDSYLHEYNTRTSQALSKREFLDDIWDTIEYNEELVRWLQRHFSIYILSDNYRENIEYVTERFNLDSWSEAAYYSYQFGMTKASPELFRQVIKRIGRPATDFIFVDDSDYKLETAAQVGLRGVKHVDNESTIAALEKLLPT